MAYPAEACPGFQSIKRLWVLLLSLDGMPVRHKVPALHFISLPWPFVGQGTLYTRGWWDAVRLKCVAREQNAKPDRASNPQPYGLTLGLYGSPKKLTCIDSIHYLLSVEFAAPDPSQQRCFLRSSFLPQISGQHIIQRTTACHPPPRHGQRLHRWHQSIRVLFGQVRSLAWPGPGCVKSVIKWTVPATLKYAKMIVWTLFLQGTVKSSCVEGKCRRVIFGVHFGKFTNQAAVFFLELLKRQKQVGVSLKICNHRKIPAITPLPTHLTGNNAQRFQCGLLAKKRHLQCYKAHETADHIIVLSVSVIHAPSLSLILRREGQIIIKENNSLWETFKDHTMKSCLNNVTYYYTATKHRLP